MTVIAMVRGPGHEPSIIGIERCTTEDNLLLALLLVSSFVITFLGIRVVANEYKEKKEAGYSFVRGDQNFTYMAITKLALISMLSAFLVATVGVTPGAFFLIIMVSLEMNTAVAVATGIFLVMITAGSATINLLVFQLLNTHYSLLVNIFTVVGTIPGVYG